jgi:hypothetical protein
MAIGRIRIVFKSFPNLSTVFPQSMLVDYVPVYKGLNPQNKRTLLTANTSDPNTKSLL